MNSTCFCEICGRRVGRVNAVRFKSPHKARGYWICKQDIACRWEDNDPVEVDQYITY